MLSDALLVCLIGSVFLCWLVASFVIGLRQAKESDPIRRGWMNFKLTSIFSGTVLVILALALPSAPSLGTFVGLDDLRDPLLLTKYLHDYGHAVVRTTEVVGGLLFVLVWFFGSALYDFLRIMAKPPARPLSGAADAVTGAAEPLTGQ